MDKNRNSYEVASIITNGSLKFTDEYTEIRGNVNIGKELTFDGDATIYGDVTADTIKVAGNLEVNGNLTANVLEVEGEVLVEKSARIADACSAAFYVKEDLESTVEIETGILMVGRNLKAFVVSLGDDANEELEDLLLVDGKVCVEEAIYVNEKAEFINEEEILLSE